MPFTKDHILAALAEVDDPATGRPLNQSGAVAKVASCDGFVSLTIACPEDDRARRNLRNHIDTILRAHAQSHGEELKELNISFTAPGTSPGRAPGTAPGKAPAPAGPTMVQQPRDIPMKQAASSPTVRQGATTPGAPSPSLPGVKHIIAVGAGKGGVGKSTISVNLAVGLARAGHAVGLLDGDIYGPSLPTLLGLDAMDTVVHQNMLQPFYVHGVKAMTIGKLVDPDKPLIWRGPMAHGAFKQLVEQTSWGELDYLIIDLPPGTGDVSLTMAQMLSLTGAIIVCTPQKVAQDDAVRAVRMFQQLQIQVLGVVENMSYFVGDDGKEYDLFGRGGAEQMAQRLGMPFLGSVPISTALRRHSDDGTPLRNFTDAGDALRRAFDRLVANTEAQAAMAGLRRAASAPTLSVS